MRAGFTAVALSTFLATASVAAPLTIEIKGARSDKGLIRVAICDTETCYAKRGPFAAQIAAPADPGGTRFAPVDLPPGQYAAYFFHDEDGDNEFDKTLFFPAEGFGFSNDIEPVFGRPPFWAVAFEHGEEGGALSMTVQY